MIRQRTDLPNLLDVLEANERRDNGPPQEPKLAAYEHVLSLARRMLFLEADPPRREALVKDFDERVERIEEIFSGHETLRAQVWAIRDHWKELNFPALDLRKHRTARGPTDLELLEQYEAELPKIRRICREEGKDPIRRIRRLRDEYRNLSQRKAATAASESPARATYIVIGALHALSWERIRDRCTVARSQKRLPERTER